MARELSQEDKVPLLHANCARHYENDPNSFFTDSSVRETFLSVHTMVDSRMNFRD